METDSLADLRFNFLDSFACRDAARQIRHISRIIAFGLFNHNRVAHQRCSFSPACFKSAKSSDGLPAIVTRPGLLECLNWRWLPRVATKYQPSRSISRIASRTFTP